MKDANIINTPLLVVSCDRYSDLWQPFFGIFYKQWPDCPYRVFLGTNYKDFEDKRVTAIPVGTDISWASGLQIMLDRINSEYVILFLEDFFIKQPVHTDHIQKLVTLGIKHNVGCLRLTAGLPLALPLSEPVAGIDGVGVIGKTVAYRVSAQVALWRTNTLRKLLISGMNAWEFEEIGTPLSVELDEPFWGVYEPAIHYSQCVEKGKWKPEGLQICREAGVFVDLEARGTFSNEELEQYFMAMAEKNQETLRIQYAINAFSKSQGFFKLKTAINLIKLSPFNIKLWLFILAGLLYPPLFPTFQQYKLKYRLGKIRNRIKRGEAIGPA